MKRSLFVTTILAALFLVAVSASAQFENVGLVEFPNSGSVEAQPYFLRGVAILHSFGWKQAIEQFQKAQELDPDFAMAYWGESLCYNHPLFGNMDMDSPRDVLKRLGTTREERLAKAPTDREKGFLTAVEVLFGEGEIAERKLGYMDVMRTLYEKYPDDDEVATFYALSTIAAVRPAGDTSFRMYVEAGSVAMKVFQRNPNHPGAAHYTIHSFDDPVHAPLALPAAYRFAEIAPAVSHARHMPTHIFIQHGMWDRVSKSNQSAYDAAVDLWEPGDSVGDMVHALDWGQYGDLQLGDYKKAWTWIERLEKRLALSEGATRAARSVPLLKARYIIETEKWKTEPVTEKSSAHELLATGMSAYKLGDGELVAKAAEQLRATADKQAKDESLYNRSAQPTRVMQHEVQALAALAKGDKDGAVQHLKKGIEVAESMRPPAGAANPVKPVYELAGDVMLEIGKPAEAVTYFKKSLLRTPNRPRSLLGLARAYAEQGERALATAQYRKLEKVWSAFDVPELKEATEYLSSTDAEDR